VVLTALAVLMGGGCAGYTSSIKPDAPYDPSRTYLYGRFHIEAAPGSHSDLVMGFMIRCRDEKKYTFRFDHDDRVQVLELAPSACQIDDLVFTESSGRVLWRSMAEFRLLKNEFLSPGGVYYVGDFAAQTTDVSTMTRQIFSTTTTRRMAWRVTSMKDNYSQTTSELKKTHPNLRSVSTEDRMPRQSPSTSQERPPPTRLTSTHEQSFWPVIVP
jgi:hypothetical protein